MNEKDNGIIFMETDMIEKSLGLISNMADELEEMDKDNIEKVQHIETIKEHIDMIVSQISTVKERLNQLAVNPLFVTNLSLEAFKMRDTKVLIVDDNEINNDVVKQMLSRLNIEVDTAISGQEAIQLFETKNYDMILMDYLMPPGIDGIETVRRIRQCGEKGKQQLIIGITSNNSDVFRQGMNQYNVELILMKPVKYQHLSVILQKEFPDKVDAQIV